MPYRRSGKLFFQLHRSLRRFVLWEINHFKPLSSTMSLVTLPRVANRRVPSGDQLTSKIRPEVYLVICRDAPLFHRRSIPPVH
jgi:hypothetical protein